MQCSTSFEFGSSVSARPLSSHRAAPTVHGIGATPFQIHRQSQLFTQKTLKTRLILHIHAFKSLCLTAGQCVLPACPLRKTHLSLQKLAQVSAQKHCNAERANRHRQSREPGLRTTTVLYFQPKPS